MNSASIRQYGELLRDGDWQTLEGAFHYDGQMCVEGRLCDLTKIGEWVIPVGGGSITSKYRDLLLPNGKVFVGNAPLEMYDVLLGSRNYLPQFTCLLRQFVKEHPKGRSISDDEPTNLAYLNDVRMFTVQEIGEIFVQIADYLDAKELTESVEDFLARSRVAEYAI